MQKCNKIFGGIGEQIAAKFLQDKKYKIIKTNYESKYGEIDIIAKRRKVTVFVEVKTRFGTNYGFAAEAVDYRKRKHIIGAAKYYIYKEKPKSEYRFDVIEVYGSFVSGDFELEKINHIENAFEVSENR